MTMDLSQIADLAAATIRISTPLLFAALGAAIIGCLLAFATARCRADQMVTGLAVNVLVLGLSSFLLRGLFGGRAPVIRLATLGTWPIPFLADLPILGPI